METDIFKRQLRILHLEDNDHDHLLVTEMLHADGLDCHVAQAKSHNDFARLLRKDPFDLIISDFTLPSYDGLSALSLAQSVQPETPFIFFSGTIGEEVAVESLKNGATDYVLKQRPHRLIAAVHRAVRNQAERQRLKRAERQLQQSEERFRIVSRTTNDVIWEWDIQNNKIFVSQNFQSAFGGPAGDAGFSSEYLFELIHPDDQPRVKSTLFSLLAGGGKVWWSEHRLRRINGSYALVLDRASVIYDADRKPVRMVGVTIDITEQRKAEEKIREQAELLDKAQDGIMVVDNDGRINFWSKGAERVYGWTSEEAVGRMHSQLLFKNVPSKKIESLTENGEWTGEITEVKKDGQEIIVQSRVTIIRDARDEPKSRLIINTDITERKKLEEQFLRAQRLESLGVLVSGIAHDLNNALAPILIGTSLLRDEPLTKEGRNVLEMMENGARHGSEMIRQVLTFARGGTSSKVIINADRLVKEMCKIITDTFPKNIRCSCKDIAPDAWPVSGQHTQLHQVLMNLCVNARDAMPDGGTLTLSVRNVQLKASDITQPDVQPGNFLCISVADTGTGIPPEQLDKIFEPFFTTKAPGHGTGLGLPTSLTIVKKHGGFMTVETEPGKGTEFKIFLPAAVSSEKKEETVEPPPAGHGEAILIIDDEESVLAITRTALEHYGYQILTASGGFEAITAFSKKKNDIDLVITDLSMPFMDGRDTINALRDSRPDIKIVAFSGSVKGMDMMKEELKVDAFVVKPFVAEELLRVVHNVLKKTPDVPPATSR